MKQVATTTLVNYSYKACVHAMSNLNTHRNPFVVVHILYVRYDTQMYLWDIIWIKVIVVMWLYHSSRETAQAIYQIDCIL